MILASGVQGGGPHPPGAPDALIVLLLIAAMIVTAALACLYLRRRRREPPVEDHWRALAMMGELCPHGWQAQLTLYGWGAPVPSDAPPSRTPLVEVEWKLFDDAGGGRVAVARRAWARSIPQALQMILEDRRTDVTLEQIEQAGGGEDVWSEM